MILNVLLLLKNSMQGPLESINSGLPKFGVLVALRALKTRKNKQTSKNLHGFWKELSRPWMNCTQKDSMLKESSNNPVLTQQVVWPSGEMIVHPLLRHGLLQLVQFHTAKVMHAMQLKQLNATKEMMLPTNNTLLLTIVSLLLLNMATLNGRTKPWSHALTPYSIT